TAEEVTEKSDAVADQLALAASHTEKNPHRRGGAYASDGEDYPYGNLEMNLIRPESEPVHTQITAKYTASLSAARPYESGSLEDAETAEEYVANAMKMQRYGTRLREPIRILSTESAVQSPPRTALQSSEDSTSNRESSAPANIKYEYYNVPQQQQQQQQQSSQQLEENHRALLEAQMRAQLQAQIQQAQQQVESQQQQQQLEPQTERSQAITAVNADNGVAQQSAPTYGREPATRAYEVYDDSVNSYEANGDGGGAADGDGVDRHYRTKYIFQPAYPGAGVPQAEPEPEQLRVSASTEIPKAEIMKQIEKSVMKYMKELEAEGKIVTSPQETKPYHKTVTLPAQDKHFGSTTARPKYPSATPSHNALYVSGDSGSAVSSPATAAHRAPSASSISGYASSARHHAPKHQLKSAQRYQAEAETAYRASAGGHQSHELTEALAPNVEFVYKIKTRAPLQTATVKTISKPYTLPLKGNFEHFDHTAALKNLEDFDLSHVVTTQEPDERPSSLSASVTGKPNKLYFNSEIYHDINSLPYKPEKSRGLSAAAAAAEYRKLKASGELNGDYKGYSGYFAEPAPPAEASDEKETSGSASASGQVSDDGYPLMNPYQYVLKKEPLPSKYEETSASWVEAHAKPVYTALTASQKGLEYDSYSPKFNNNPEGYGYQHSYKVERERERERERDREREPQHNGHKYTVSRPNGASSKRGKRGGGLPYPNVSKKGLRGAAVKDIEANLALRPPPKK
ncbi:PREDICTED: uncharacterized protein LOC108355092, partial [Rhagoletis zephyria]|uniref:uncharacterized protein LOC108355092 n=1 Tax=Rhagoletis zephyria TaxID=28612 RepID=UPI00081194DD